MELTRRERIKMKIGYIIEYRTNAEMEKRIRSMGNVTVVEYKKDDKKMGHVILEKNN